MCIRDRIKTEEQLAGEKQQQLQMQQQQMLLSQAGQLAKSPLADPEKNPEGIQSAVEQLQTGLSGQQANQLPPTEEE